MNKISAIIFDMDGVVSDTQKLHAMVESEILARFDINISPEDITRRYAGVKTSEFFGDLLAQQSRPYDVEELMGEKWRMMAQLEGKSISEVEGATKLIRELYELGYRMAIASASSQDYVVNVINSLSLRKYFEHLISGDMVTRGKPDPEIFLLAASRLDALPENCLVIEDGESGMKAAKTAGMKCIGLVEDKEVREYPTKNLICSLSEINVDYINSLI